MKITTRTELIHEYIKFFKSKQHTEIPSAPLVPQNDPTVLFNTAGMQPLVPFLLGKKHPLGTRLVDVQKCIRTNDIEEVGDANHHTFFEMLGNWSLGDYFKEESIKFSYEFLTQVLKIPKEKLAVTCFGGDPRIPALPKDEESFAIWKSIGIPEERIAFLQGGVLESKKNWWGPAGQTGPCGPDTEIFYWTGGEKTPKKYNPEDERWVEIWNNVFMQYNKTEKGDYVSLKQKNVDTGMGLERTLAVLNNYDDNYETTIFKPIIHEIEKIAKKKYKGHEKEMRIIADHIRAATFILGDSMILPSNIGHGYVLRRLIRRAIRYGKLLNIQERFTAKIAEAIIPLYPEYPELKNQAKFILDSINEEENKFNQTLEKGLKKFEELVSTKKISGKDAFLLFQSFGFPIEMTQELAKEKNIPISRTEFDEEMKQHQDLSRSASAGTFKSGLADNSEQTTKLHTATHLLNEALRIVLKDETIRQKGSNITPERLRFDFNFSRKLTPEEISAIETLVNKKIKEALSVTGEEISLQKAQTSGAQAEFGAKYPERVTVYTIVDTHEKRGWFSKEICTGPHVMNTKEIGTFKIIKEEAVAAGIRRIKATVH